MLRIGIQNTPEALAVVTDLLYADRLLSIDWHGRPALGLASGFAWKDEGRTLQIELRPGIQFHDGTPVTAETVAEILRQKRTPSGSFQYVTRIENTNDRTVLIHLSRPDAFLIEALSGTAIVLPRNPDIGAGPFKLLKRTPVIEAERNMAYYRGAPGIEKVQVTTYDTPRMAWAAMMRREVDMVPEVSRDSVEFLEGATRFDTYSSIRPFYIPLVFNARNPILKNVEVRRAIAEAIDRDDIVNRAMRGHGRAADDPVWPYNWAYTPAARRRSFDPMAAAQRLDKAGFPVRRAGLPGAMPSRFQIRCLFWNKGSQYERIALMLQRQLAAIDIDLLLEPADEEALQRRAFAGEFESYLYQMASGKSFDWTYVFWHSPQGGGRQRQNSGYTGLDEPLDRLRAAAGDADTRVAVADIRERFYDDVPAVFIAWPKATRAIDARFDVGDATDPEILANLWRWSVAKPQQKAAR
jgi:peptide/nickel transport system substrate-binding protein